MSNSSKTIRLGAIGIDSSHILEFTRRIKALNDAGLTPCRVTEFFDPGAHDMPAGEVAKWREATVGMGVGVADTINDLLGRVDGVLVLAVNGHRHAELALPVLERGLPTYIDKPLTCELPGARRLLAAARASGARCYSASSLRFAGEVTGLDREKLGKLAAIDAFGPGELNPAMAGLFFYGVHTIEMVDALWGVAGGGVKRVSAVTSENRDLLDLDYRDGRYARLRMERKGCYEFGATVHGEKGVTSFKVDFADVYNRLVKGMTGFFEGGPAPAGLRDIVENVAVMEAGNASMARDGAWVDVPVIE